jgi:hypothetical protein
VNGALLQDRIYAGYAKDALHTGYLYEIYRSDTPISPLEAGNKIGSTYCRFAALVDKKPHQYKIPNYTLFADGRVLQQRDILVNPDHGTWFIGDMQHLLPMQAVKCNDVLQINRPVYQTDPIAVVDGDLVAIGLPVFRQLKKVDQKPVNSAYGASTAATPIGEWFVFAPIDWTLLKQMDLVTDEDGRRYTISTIDPTELGAVLVMRQADTEGEG